MVLVVGTEVSTIKPSKRPWAGDCAELLWPRQAEPSLLSAVVALILPSGVGGLDSALASPGENTPKTSGLEKEDTVYSSPLPPHRDPLNGDGRGP